MFTIHFANRFETLSGLLAAQLGAGARPVFCADQVIVPSAAVRRQLTLELARRHGVCANVHFGYLAQWLWQMIARVVPGVQSESPFDAAVLAWRIVAAFEEPGWSAGHERLAAYLERSDAVMRYELATRLAGIFDQYITFRPEWLAAWSIGETVDFGTHGDAAQADQSWQAALWRRLSAELGSDPPAAAFVEALHSRGTALVGAGTLPAAVHVFCLPTLPPLHLGLLQALGGCVDVQLYALNPCREYWFEVVDRRRLAYLAAQGRADHHEEAHRLLAAWGQQTQSRLGLLVEACGDAVIDDARFDEPAGGALLARLQGSILDLADLAPASVALHADDRSIEVHVCHSLGRELEVLQDRLLALFAGPDAPEPCEILVVTPDLDAAAPLVDAIFGTSPMDRHIPYQVTGRARTSVNASARALLELLALAGSRFTASAVFGLLQQPLVARRFGLDGAGLDRVHGWLQDAGVHWALDGEHRASLGLPAEARHSFGDGLERLFLGYALPTQAGAPFAGSLPAGDAEGSDALALGALWCFVDALAALRRSVSAPQTAPSWPALLAEALQRFVAPRGDELEDLQEVLSALDAFAGQLQHGGLTQPLPLDVVRSALTQALADPARGGVPTGAVTFSAMSSLRNLPYKVICAIGLNDGAFPTAARPAEFDLMALQPRRGDRQRRIDERNLFLDLLLAARERLHLSYVGRSVRDNAVLPASVLVSELLEYLVPAIAEDPADAASRNRARARLVVEHPLQAFSESAFRLDGDPRLRSFHREYAEALRQRLAAPVDTHAPETAADLDATDDDERGVEPAQPFFRAPLAPPGDEWRDVSLDRLVQFFGNPCRFLLRQRLGIELDRDAEELQDDEPFLPDVPGRSALAARLLPALLAGADLEAVRELALGGTEVPAGAFGRRFLERELDSLQRFAMQLRELTVEPTVAPHSVVLELTLDGRAWRVQGGFADLRARGLVRHRYDEPRARDVLSAWLHHLLLCAAPPAGVALRTTWQARDERFSLAACANPREVLRDLLALYERGLSEPLSFFPKTAWAYAKKAGSVSAATGAWRSTRQHPFGEDADPADPPRLARPARSDGRGLRGLRCLRPGGVRPAARVPARPGTAMNAGSELDVFACPLDGTTLIEASAGTGKTWALCGLYLRLLLERQLDVQHILVVTFTNAATAELRERIRGRIVETLAHLRSDRRRPRDSAAARRPVRAAARRHAAQVARAGRPRHDRPPRARAADLRRGRDLHDPRLLPARAGRHAVQRPGCRSRSNWCRTIPNSSAKRRTTSGAGTSPATAWTPLWRPPSSGARIRPRDSQPC